MEVLVKRFKHLQKSKYQDNFQDNLTALAQYTQKAKEVMIPFRGDIDVCRSLIVVSENGDALCSLSFLIEKCGEGEAILIGAGAKPVPPSSRGELLPPMPSRPPPSLEPEQAHSRHEEAKTEAATGEVRKEEEEKEEEKEEEVKYEEVKAEEEGDPKEQEEDEPDQT